MKTRKPAMIKQCAKAKRTASAKPQERIGRVVVATALLENAESRKYLCETLFARFCPFTVSVSPKGTLRAFTGFCDDFEPIRETDEVPQYVMSVKQDQKGVKTVTFRKVGNEPAAGDGK